jgi:alkylhydroperoxidase family enzyme
MNENNIRELRHIGYKDEEILEINLIVSYFNFVNRIASGLGVEFTEEEIKGYQY